MALFSRVTTWVSNQVLTASALNGEFNNILNNAQLSSWIGFSANVSQMQQQTDPGGVGTESLAGSGSDELQRLRYILSLALGQTYWYDHSDVVTSLKTSGVVTASIAAANVTTAKIAALNITTALINTGAVTRPKLVAVGQQISNGSGTFSTGSTSATDVTNLTVTLTTTGRPVKVFMQPVNSGSSVSRIYVSNDTDITAIGVVSLVRDASTIALARFSTVANTAAVELDTSYIMMLDPVVAGTYVYKIQAKLVSGLAIGVENFQLVAYEL